MFFSVGLLVTNPLSLFFYRKKNLYFGFHFWQIFLLDSEF